jgi:hypothetical protein
MHIVLYDKLHTSRNEGYIHFVTTEHNLIKILVTFSLMKSNDRL